jgi:hypothetical protein
MDGKTGRDNRMVCSQRRLETPIFVYWIFAVYGDSLEVLSLDELALEAIDIKKDCRIFAGNPFVKKS